VFILLYGVFVLQEQLTLPVGTTLQDRNGNSYVVERVLGKGGFSAVYLVKQQSEQQKTLALKEVIGPTKQQRVQLAFEAELLRRLEHRALPHVYQIFEDVNLNRVYMLMDYVQGKDLEVLRREQPDARFSVAFSLTLMAPIFDAISYLHSQDIPIVHRDIKPSNIIVPNGTTGAVLVDFGLAKEFVENKTTSAFRYGTPGYAAPEQYNEGTNLRTDIYALGATLYTLLTGQIPPDALKRSIEHRVKDPLMPAHAICPVIPPSISHVLGTAMNLRSDERYASVDEFWDELDKAANQPDETLKMRSIPITPIPANHAAQDAQQAVKKQSPAPNPNVAVAASSAPVQKRHKKGMSTLLLGFLILLIIFLGSLGAYVYAFRGKYFAPTSVSQATSVPTRPKASTPGLDLNSFCPQHATMAKLNPGDFAPMAVCYAGTIAQPNFANTAGPSQGSPMFLWAIHQTNGEISGMFLGLQSQTDFQGTTSEDGSKVQFSLFLSASRTYFIFEGTNYLGRMTGNYTVENTSHEQTGETGVFNVQAYIP
jgi:serine/threonine protein kinase